MNDLIDRQMVSYKLTDLVNEFEEILSHIREREENDCVCALCKYDAGGAYIGQSGDWCNECPGFDKADCFELNDKYKKEWLECMNTLPSVQPEEVIPHRNYKYLSDYWCECGWHLGKKGEVKYCSDCGRKVNWDEKD